MPPKFKRHLHDDELTGSVRSERVRGGGQRPCMGVWGWQGKGGARCGVPVPIGCGVWGLLWGVGYGVWGLWGLLALSLCPLSALAAGAVTSKCAVHLALVCLGCAWGL